MSDTIYGIVEGRIQGMPMELMLEWSDDDPWAVMLGFTEDNEWLVARDLLADGLANNGKGAGDGDISVSPQYLGGEVMDMALLWLRSPSGEAFVEIDREGALEFLKQTYEKLPAGSETIPDSEFEKLLEGTS